MNAPTQVGRSDRSRGSVRDLFEQGERLRADLRALGEAATHLTRGWQSLVRDRIERRPYATLAAAAGVGYVLGGGLPTTLLRVLVGVGGRIAVERFVAGIVDATDHRTT